MCNIWQVYDGYDWDGRYYRYCGYTGTTGTAGEAGTTGAVAWVLHRQQACDALIAISRRRLCIVQSTGEPADVAAAGMCRRS